MALMSIFSSSLLSLFFCFSTWPQCWIFLAIGSSATTIRENLRDKKEGERELLCALFDLSKELRWQGEQRKKRKMIKESKFSCKDIWKKSKDTGPRSAKVLVERAISNPILMIVAKIGEKITFSKEISQCFILMICAMQQFDEQKKRERLFTRLFFGIEVLQFDDQKEMKANEEKKQKK